MEKLQIPARQYRAGAITAGRVDGAEDDDRRVVLSFSSETPVERDFGFEVLGHRDGEVDLDWIASGRAPLLIDHRADLDNQVGVVESAKLSDGRGTAVVRFGKSARADEILARVRDGEVTAVSAGYRIDQMELVGTKNGQNVYRATRWTVLEITLTAIPADTSVGVGRRSGDGDDVIEIKVQERTQPMPNPNPAPTDPTPAPNPDPNPTPETRAAPAPAAPRTETVEDIRRAETARVLEIRSIARKCNIGDDVLIAAENDGTSVAEFSTRALDHMTSAEAESSRAGASVIGLTEKEANGFSFTRALNFLANPNDPKMRNLAGFEIEVSEAAQKATKRETAGILIPFDVTAQQGYSQRMAPGRREEVRSALTVGTAASAGDLVDESFLAGSFIDILRNTAVLPQLGVRVMSGLSGDIAIPRQTGAGSFNWIAEDAAATETAQTVDQVKMSPNTASAHTSYSRKLLIQSSIDVENFIRADLAAIIALGIDHAGLNGNADADAPDGLNDTAGILTQAFAVAGEPTYDEIVGMWTKVAAANALMGSLGYALNPVQTGHLMTTPKFASGDTPIMATDNILNGYKAPWSNQVVAGESWFGNWSDFIVGFWSGLDLTVDPYTNATSGAVRVVVHQDVDFAVRHAQSFCKGS